MLVILTQRHFAKQNQMSGGHLSEVPALAENTFFLVKRLIANRITPFSRDPIIAKVANSILKMQLRCFCNLDCLRHPSNRTPVNEKYTAVSRDFAFTRKHESKLSVFL